MENNKLHAKKWCLHEMEVAFTCLFSFKSKEVFTLHWHVIRLKDAKMSPEAKSISLSKNRWSLNNMDNNDSSQLFPVMSGIGTHPMPHNGTQTDEIHNYLLRLVFFSLKQKLLRVPSLEPLRIRGAEVQIFPLFCGRRLP
ncbi:hypothetical protein ACFE04_019396 [Oxalis oulophora]